MTFAFTSRSRSRCISFRLHFLFLLAKGLAVFIEPDDVVVPPFGVADITLEAVADLWGCYKDSLVCIIMEEEDQEGEERNIPRTGDLEGYRGCGTCCTFLKLALSLFILYSPRNTIACETSQQRKGQPWGRRSRGERSRRSGGRSRGENDGNSCQSQSGGNSCLFSESRYGE